MNIEDIYASKHYKKLLIVPAILAVIFLFYAMQIKMGIEFTGGSLITAPIEKDVDANALKASILAQHDLIDLDVRQTGSELSKGIYVQFSGERSLIEAQEAYEAKDYATAIRLSKAFTGELNVSGNDTDAASTYFSRAREAFRNSLISSISAEIGTPEKDFSIRDIGPSLGEMFWQQGRNAMIMAFIFISCLIFIFFRHPLVSFAVIQAAVFDVLAGAALLGFTGTPMSMASLAPLLMLIGYSVDSDIMLTERLIKRKGENVYKMASWALKTGVTMTCTTLAAVLALFAVSSLAGIEVLTMISSVLLAGLLADLVSTWITNITIVLWVIERKASGKKGFI